MQKPSLITAILLGIIIGYGCERALNAGDDGTALADEALCSQWEMDTQSADDPIPAGWAPFAWEFCGSGYACLAVRRCAD